MSWLNDVVDKSVDSCDHKSIQPYSYHNTVTLYKLVSYFRRWIMEKNMYFLEPS